MSDPKTYSCREITLEVAQDLINCGGAGFYAYRAQSPIDHSRVMCVYAQGKWWLIENGEFQVEDQGIVTVPEIPGGWTRAHLVTAPQGRQVPRLPNTCGRV
jgi:hypothetical protein